MYNNANYAFKLNLSLGIIYRHIHTLAFRYFIPCHNQNVFNVPILMGLVRWCWVSLQCRGVLLIWSGWSGGAKVLSNLAVPGRPTIWTTVGQGPTALDVGAGGGCLDILLLSILSLLFLPLF